MAGLKLQLLEQLGIIKHIIAVNANTLNTRSVTFFDVDGYGNTVTRQWLGCGSNNGTIAALSCILAL